MTTALVALPVLVGIAAAYARGERVALDAASRSFSRARDVRSALLDARAARLESAARTLAADPAFRGYVAEAIFGGLGPERAVGALSLTDLLDERARGLAFDFAVLTDDSGRVVARNDRPPTSVESIAERPPVREALRDLGSRSGLWTERGRLFQVAVVPVVAADQVVGILVAGVEVDDAVAAEIAKVADVDVAFVVGDARGRPRVVASTLDRRRLDELPLGPEGLPEDGSVRVLRLGGERAVTRRDRLTGDGGPLVEAVSLASLDRLLEPFRAIRRAVVLAGAVALAASLVLSLLLSRRALRPVRALADAAEAAARGDLDRRIGSERHDEIGRMARAFDALLDDLRERRATADYLREVARGLPDDGDTGAISGPPDPDAPTAAPEDVAPGAAPRLRRGDVLAGRYEISAVLGSGGMGTVYRARDRDLGETVALKTLHASARDQLDRLKDEIRTARRITHPNVLRTFDFGEHDGVAFITMEHARGITLRDLLRRTGRLPAAAALGVSRALCSGLAAVHDAGIVHRDVKPENVILLADGGVKLMDFGIAAPLRPGTGRTGRARIGFAGTPRYLAPELFEGASPDVRSDLYALGVVLAEMFSGVPPFVGEWPDVLLAEKRRGPSAWSPPADVPERIVAVVRRCIEADPAKRFPGVEALRRDLEAARR